MMKTLLFFTYLFSIYSRSSKSDSAIRALGAFGSPRGYEKTRGNSGPPITHRPEDNLVNEQVLAEVYKNCTILQQSICICFQSV